MRLEDRGMTSRIDWLIDSSLIGVKTLPYFTGVIPGEPYPTKFYINVSVVVEVVNFAAASTGSASPSDSTLQFQY